MDKKIKHLFLPLVSDNTDDDNVAIFIDQTRSIAFGGFRRSWGAGDFFVRYSGNIQPFEWSEQLGVYHFSTETFQTGALLPGRKLADGSREGINEERCQEIFGVAYQQVKGHHQLVFNPKEVLEFIEKRTARSGINDRVINIQGFEGINSRGQFAAKIDVFEGRQAILTPSPRGVIVMYVDSKNSLFPTDNLRIGEWVVVEPLSIVMGERFVKVLRLHEPGIRMAIQYLKSGLLMPGDPRYSVHDGEDNNSIIEADVRTFPFLEDQDKSKLRDAPMMTIQLDTFVRSLKAMSQYKRVEMLYKNSFTPYLLTPFVKEGEAVVDVVASSFSQYKSGKVVTL